MIVISRSYHAEEGWTAVSSPARPSSARGGALARLRPLADQVEAIGLASCPDSKQPRVARHVDVTESPDGGGPVEHVLPGAYAADRLRRGGARHLDAPPRLHRIRAIDHGHHGSRGPARTIVLGPGGRRGRPLIDRCLP